jgi:hypothetical protein
MQGSLSQIDLNDILLLATGGKKSGLLRLSRGKETVDVFFSEGAIIHATCPIGEGEKALLYPVTWSDGTFALLPNGAPPAQTIQKDSVQILSEIKAMSQEWKQILEVIPSNKMFFRIADLGEEQSGPVTVPHAGWRVLSKIDGIRNAQEIADILRVPYAYAAKVIYNLHKAKLIEKAPQSSKDAAELVPPAFFHRVIELLTEVMGPMASVVAREKIAALGESRDSFPEGKLGRLVELVRAEILDKKLRDRFQKMIYEEISKFKKL